MIRRYVVWNVFYVFLVGTCFIAMFFLNVNNRIVEKTRSDQFHASIFPFDAMYISKNSSDHPFTYAKRLIQYQLKLELSNGINLKNFPAKIKLPLDRLEESVTYNNKDANQSKEMNEISISASVKGPTKARHVLIAATWRSGSTFLGDLLSRYPGVFYSYEPLYYYDPDDGAFKDDRKINFEKKMSPWHIKFLLDVFKCKPESGYFIHAMEPKHHHIFARNFRLWNVCKHLLSERFACFIPDLYLQVCPIFPIRVIKTVRMRVTETERLLLDSEIKQTLKIVVLVRDPRGIINSRVSLDWCRLQGTLQGVY